MCDFKFLRVSIVIIIQCIYKHEGDTPFPLRTEYRLTTKHTRTEYRLATTTKHFRRFHLHKENKIKVYCMTCTIILESISFDVFAR